MNTKKNKIRVDLRILEFPMHPDEITEMLGVPPRRIWLKGQPVNPRSGVINKRNGWELSSGLDKFAEFGEHVQALVDIIMPNIERFAEICNLYHAELSCAVYVYYDTDESTPWLG